MLTSSFSPQFRLPENGPAFPFYRLTVKGVDERDRKLDIAAPNAAEAVLMAAAAGVTVQAIDTPGLPESSGRPSERLPLLLFSQELLALLDAGLNLTEVCWRRNAIRVFETTVLRDSQELPDPWGVLPTACRGRAARTRIGSARKSSRRSSPTACSILPRAACGWPKS
jgi:hypothetical protein